MPSYSKWAMKLALGCAASLGTAPAWAADVVPQRVPTATAAAPAGETKPIDLEVIRERYPDRSVKVERHVSQDANLNYINHGAWTMWDPAGNVLAKGEYWQGKRHGEWKRFFPVLPEEHPDNLPDATASANDALNTGDYKAFKRPFTSQATFVEDKIVGTWSVIDAEGKTLFSIDVDREVPQGKLVQYHPNGQKKREIDFRSGIVNGEWCEYDANGQPTRRDRYLEGRRQAEAATKHESNGEKSSEGTYLYAKEVVKVELDFWSGNLKMSIAGTEGKTIKQGKWTYWYEDGGKRCEAEYIDDKAVGRHTWWFRNGQKESEGEFADGNAMGTWVYWHENGQKAAQGDYLNGQKVGRWVRWSDEGKVVENKDHGAGEGKTQQAGQPNGQNAFNYQGFQTLPNGQVIPNGQFPGQTFVVPQQNQPNGLQPIPQTSFPMDGQSNVVQGAQGQMMPQQMQYPSAQKNKSGGLFRRR